MNKLLIIGVIGILLGTTLIPIVNSEFNPKDISIKVSTSQGITKEKDISIGEAEKLSAMFDTLLKNQEEFEIYLPLILKEMEGLGLIKNATQMEKEIVENIRDPQFNQQDELFINAFCFIAGQGTNSGIVPLSLISYLIFCRMFFRIIQYFPLIHNITSAIAYYIIITLFYLPRIFFPFGVWHIGWEGEISTLGLLGHKKNFIHGGKWGENYLIFGFTGLWITYDMGDGYPATWFIGSTIAVLGK